MVTPSNVSITSEKNVTIDDLLNEAGEIYKRYKSYKIDIRDFNRLDDYLKSVQNEHKEFATSYPIVLRYMIQMGIYHRNAFKKYLRKLANKYPNSEEEYLEYQADYICLLYKETTPHYKVEDANAVRKNALKQLKDEKDHFKVQLEKSKAEVEEIEKNNIQEKKEELISYLLKHKLDIKERMGLK